MDLDEMRQQWQKAPIRGTAGLPLEDMMATLRTRAATLDRELRRRDWIETSAALAVGAVFATLAWYATSPVARIGCALVLFGGALTIVRLHRARRGGPPDAAMRAFCAQELARVDAQIRLLRSIVWWYLLPLLGGATLFAWGAGGPVAGLVTLVPNIACGAIIYRLNQRAVASRLEPLRAAFAELAAELSQR